MIEILIMLGLFVLKVWWFLAVIIGCLVLGGLVILLCVLPLVFIGWAIVEVAKRIA